MDRWLEQKSAKDSAIEYDLGSSVGPSWTLQELLRLEPAFEGLFDTPLLYTAAAGSLELRTALADLQTVGPEDIQIVTGAAEALWILFFLAAEPGANVIVPRPGFPPNVAMPESLGIEVRFYTLRPADSFRADVDEIAGLIDRNTKLVLVNTPHNPTGAVMSEGDMTRLHDLCAERQVQFVSDEVYHPVYHGPEMRSAARLPHATVLGDFSKAFCLSGLRVGWMVERDAGRRARYETARSYFTVTNTSIGEKLATLAVRQRTSIVSRACRVSERNLAELDRFFAEHAELTRWVRPAGGMTAFPWLVDERDSREFCTRLAQLGVLVVPGDCFGMPTHFRIGFAATDEGFGPALSRLAECMTRV